MIPSLSSARPRTKLTCLQHATRHPVFVSRHSCRPLVAAQRTLQQVAAAQSIEHVELPDVDYQDTGAVQGDKARFKDFTMKELRAWCEANGEEPKRAMHIWRWMYYDKNWIRDFADTTGQTNGFAKAFVEKVSSTATLDSGLHLQTVHTAEDGTQKLLFSVEGGGQEQVETVLIPVVREKGKSRITICVSSQIGCAMNCQFCYTGRMGLLRNLTTGQIVEQLVEAKRILAENPEGPLATNIVFMGMGEPMNNMDAVLAAIDIATEPLGLHFSKNKVTVSTVGLVPEIRRFCRGGGAAQLAVSLHAPTDEIRDWIVPVNRRYPLAELMGCLRDEFPKGSTVGRHGQHVLFEYVMLKGVNDQEEHARLLVDLVAGVECKFNLIIFNPHEGTQFTASSRETTMAFRAVLVQGGLVCTVRDSRGPDEMAACGQLGNAGLVKPGAARTLPRPATV